MFSSLGTSETDEFESESSISKIAASVPALLSFLVCRGFFRRQFLPTSVRHTQRQIISSKKPVQ